MSTFTTSRRTRGQHVSPKFQSAPYRQSPARRQAIYGKVQGLPDRREPLWWRVLRVAVMAACTIYALKLAVVG